MRAFFLLLTFTLIASNAFAMEVDPVYGTNFNTMKDNLIYQIIQENARGFKEKLARNPLKNQSIAFVTGKSGTAIVDHYLGMVDFLASNTPSGSYGSKDSVGNNEDGYVIARTYISEADLTRLKHLAPAAYKKYEEKNGEVSWDEFVADHEGDKALALKDILLLSSWVRGGIAKGNPRIMPSLTDLTLQLRPDKFESPYSMHPLKKDAFGLNTSASRNLDDSKNTRQWGKGYKTVAGMNLALAGKTKGYSDSDIRAMVSRAGLVYESSDLLYDHLGFYRDGIMQIPDRSQPEFQPQYQTFAAAVRKKLEQEPALLGKLIGSIFSAPELGEYLPKDSGFKTDDDLVLVFLLLNYLYEKPEEFEATFGPLFPAGNDGKKLKALFVDGVADARIMAHGGDFVLEKLKNVPLAEINPCLGEKPFQGVLHLKDQVRTILSLVE